MQLSINGEDKERKATSLSLLLREEKVPDAHWPAMAIAINGVVIPRAKWGEVKLADGDQVELVKPFVGG